LLLLRGNKIEPRCRSWVINYRDAQWSARQLRPQLRTRWRTVGAAVEGH